MKANIYALADPNTGDVRYIGGVRHHATLTDDGAITGGAITGGNYPGEVEDWIKSLLPLEPTRVHLESYRFNDALTTAENDDAALAVEAKWLRWFSNSPLLPPGETAPQESLDVA